MKFVYALATSVFASVFLSGCWKTLVGVLNEIQIH